jgi:hypothetical protein
MGGLIHNPRERSERIQNPLSVYIHNPSEFCERIQNPLFDSFTLQASEARVLTLHT